MKYTKRGIFFLIAFVLWTVAVCCVNVQPVGPESSAVGFAGLNTWFHGVTGANMGLYELTDLLSIIPLAIVAGFGLLGLVQLVGRKSLLKVDFDILALGGFYIAVIAVFLLFEVLDINFRPILIEGKLEASYPSSTTMLVLCILPTAVMQLRRRIQNPMLRKGVCLVLTVFAVFMVVGRILSGVHWITDIIGGILVSAGLVNLYRGIAYKD